jgi:geranylgeranyl reductase family protein
VSPAPVPRARNFDVSIVGAGPAGSTLAWVLAKQGCRVALLERSAFPREKVCGDFVEPGGLRILARLGVLPAIESRERLRIDRNRVYFGPRLAYRGPIRYYEGADDDIDYGLIVPRSELDGLILQAAVEAGATLFPQTEARNVTRRGDIVEVEALAGERSLTLRAPLVVGADGVESLVGRCVGLRRTNRRHIGVSQRAYVEGVEVEGGEAAVWFDEDIAPGYGWMFPMPGGLANVGVGLSSETSHRFGIPVREAFVEAVERLRIRHPGCAKARLISRPIGGVVKTYSGIDRNHFDGGLLIGDAGSFVDPMTGEGITQGMESAVLAVPAILDALDCRRFAAADLARFGHDFRRYFDPSMRFLELAAACLNNRHMAEFWLRVSAHGHEEAATDPAFARIAGSLFGGPALQPLTVSAQLWSRMFARFAQGMQEANPGLGARFADDFRAFQRGWTGSRAENPQWHAEWLADVAARTIEVQSTMWTRRNPRLDGVFRFVGLEPPSDAEPPMPLASSEAQAMILDGVRALVDAAVTFFTAPGDAPAPPRDAAPRRRWRVKP